MFWLNLHQSWNIPTFDALIIHLFVDFQCSCVTTYRFQLRKVSAFFGFFGNRTMNRLSSFPEKIGKKFILLYFGKMEINHKNHLDNLQELSSKFHIFFWHAFVYRHSKKNWQKLLNINNDDSFINYSIIIYLETFNENAVGRLFLNKIVQCND